MRCMVDVVYRLQSIPTSNTIYRMCFNLHYKCVVVIIFRSRRLFLLFIYLLLYSKNAQYSPVCYNRNTILYLGTEMSCCLLVCRNIMVVSSHWGSFSLRFDISCIKRTVTQSIVRAFINIVSMTVIKIFIRCQQTLQQGHDNVFVSKEAS